MRRTTSAGVHEADCTLTHQLAGVGVHRDGALLRAGLQHAIVLLDGLAQGQSLGHGQRERLLGVDVEPGLHGVDRDQGARVSARLDEYHVELLLIEQTPVVGVLGPARALRMGLHRLHHAVLRAVRDSDDFGAGHVVAEQPMPSAARADEPDANAVVRAHHALRIEQGQSRCGAQKIPSIHSAHPCDWLRSCSVYHRLTV